MGQAAGDAHIMCASSYNSAIDGGKYKGNCNGEKHDKTIAIANQDQWTRQDMKY